MKSSKQRTCSKAVAVKGPGGRARLNGSAQNQKPLSPGTSLRKSGAFHVFGVFLLIFMMTLGAMGGNAFAQEDSDTSSDSEPAARSDGDSEPEADTDEASEPESTGTSSDGGDNDSEPATGSDGEAATTSDTDPGLAISEPESSSEGGTQPSTSSDGGSEPEPATSSDGEASISEPEPAIQRDSEPTAGSGSEPSTTASSEPAVSSAIEPSTGKSEPANSELAISELPDGGIGPVPISEGQPLTLMSQAPTMSSAMLLNETPETLIEAAAIITAGELQQCNDMNTGAATYLTCDVTVVNNLNLETGEDSSSVTVRECTTAPGVDPTPADCTTSTTDYDELTTTVTQCNGSANAGGSTVKCTVTIINNITGEATVTPITVNQCNGSGEGGVTPAGADPLNCSPYPASTTNAVITQCNGSVNGGGAEKRVTCTVADNSTTSAALPVTVDQCNGTANGGGSNLTCDVAITYVVTPSASGGGEPGGEPGGGPGDGGPGDGGPGDGGPGDGSGGGDTSGPGDEAGPGGGPGDGPGDGGEGGGGNTNPGGAPGPSNSSDTPLGTPITGPFSATSSLRLAEAASQGATLAGFPLSALALAEGEAEGGIAAGGAATGAGIALPLTGSTLPLGPTMALGLGLIVVGLLLTRIGARRAGAPVMVGINGEWIDPENSIHLGMHGDNLRARAAGMDDRPVATTRISDRS